MATLSKSYNRYKTGLSNSGGGGGGDHACRPFADIITTRVIHVVRTGAGAAPGMHIGPNISHKSVSRKHNC